jgi:hypothetical protein
MGSNRKMRFRPKISSGRRRVRKGKQRFALLPKRMSNGTWVWLQTYRRYRRMIEEPLERFDAEANEIQV